MRARRSLSGRGGIGDILARTIKHSRRLPPARIHDYPERTPPCAPLPACPWPRVGPDGWRLRVLRDLSQGKAARRYGVSQGWISRLLAQYRVEGEAAFEPRSRRLRTSPNATAPGTAELIVRLREDRAGQGLDAGPQTIAWHLEHHRQVKVSAATVSRHPNVGSQSFRCLATSQSRVRLGPPRPPPPREIWPTWRSAAAAAFRPGRAGLTPPASRTPCEPTDELMGRKTGRPGREPARRCQARPHSGEPGDWSRADA